MVPADVTFPIESLREHTTALEAALTVCLADPAPKSVHRLRTETRRVEAMLTLLPGMPGIPEHGRETETLRRVLRRLRRAAGAVRDFDVQRKRLEELGEVKALAHGAAALRDHLGKSRDKSAAKLLKMLTRRQTKVALAAEALLTQVHSAEDVPFPAVALLERAQALLTSDGRLEKSLEKALTVEALHTVRKGAKAARYLAETLPPTLAAQAAAQRFESLQDAGGQWHDALELARTARRFLGKKHELATIVAGERDRNLRLYREGLRAEARRTRPYAGGLRGDAEGSN